MRTLLLIMTCCYLVTSCAFGATTYPTRHPTAQNAAAVPIHVMCADGDRGIQVWAGSGVAVGPTKILTAWHVADCDAGAAIVMGPGEVPAITRVVLSLPHLDVAVLEVIDGTEPWHGWTFPAIGDVADGDPICLAVALPSAARRCGHVDRVSALEIRHDVFTEPGNSGSGAYNAAGELVGIVSTYRTCRGGQICGGGVAPLVGLGRVLR